MKAVEIIENAIRELEKPNSYHKGGPATEHLKKAIVQIGINERKKKILEKRKEAEKDE